MGAHVVVVGAGVIGLTSALRLREAGHAVRVWARELSPHTTSDVAAAIWHPYRAGPRERVERWAAFAYREHRRLAADPATGVRVAECVTLQEEPGEDPPWHGLPSGYRRERLDPPRCGYPTCFVFETVVVEMPRFMPWLMERLSGLGVPVLRRPVGALDEALREADVVVHCAGLEAATLAGDATLQPVRGQVARVANPGLSRCWVAESGPLGLTYIVPRSRDCVLGGTSEAGAVGTTPDPEVREAIRERCARLEPGLRGAPLLGDAVGLRPGRDTVRLEAEAGGGKTIVHNYGHGGAGVTLCWGCAEEVRRLVAEV